MAKTDIELSIVLEFICRNKFVKQKMLPEQFYVYTYDIQTCINGNIYDKIVSCECNLNLKD